MSDDPTRRRTAPRGAELSTWAVIYTFLGWLSLAAATFGGAGEAPYYLAAGLILLPLGIGLWFRWPWARWIGLLLFCMVAAWAAWQLMHGRLRLLSVAFLLTSVETIWCLLKWPSARHGPLGEGTGAER